MFFSPNDLEDKITISIIKILIYEFGKIKKLNKKETDDDFDVDIIEI